MTTSMQRFQANVLLIKAYKHPDSALATESRPQFASKYGDPTDPSVMTNYAGRISAAMKGESLADRQTRKRAQALQPGRARGAIRRILPSVSASSKAWKTFHRQSLAD